MLYYYSSLKNEKLLKERGISFEEVIEAIEWGKALAVFNHPNQVKYLGQKIIVVEIRGCAYRVPYQREGNYMHLKTAYPCRKSTKLYLNNEMTSKDLSLLLEEIKDGHE